MKKVAMASDHAGYELKDTIKQYLVEKGYETVDFGTFSSEACDYADFAHPAANAVEKGECDFGICMCGTGNGINITLNKHQGIRAGLAWMPEIATLVKKHNDANMLVMPARFVTEYEAKNIVDAYLEAEFEGGRHLQRIKKIPLSNLKTDLNF